MLLDKVCIKYIPELCAGVLCRAYTERRRSAVVCWYALFSNIPPDARVDTMGFCIFQADQTVCNPRRTGLTASLLEDAEARPLLLVEASILSRCCCPNTHLWDLVLQSKQRTMNFACSTRLIAPVNVEVFEPCVPGSCLADKQLHRRSITVEHLDALVLPIQLVPPGHYTSHNIWHASQATGPLYSG